MIGDKMSGKLGHDDPNITDKYYDDSTIEVEEISKIPYQAAIEAIGFVKGYIDGNDHDFSEKFIDAIRALSQFVAENPPLTYEICQLPISNNIEELMGSMERLETQ